MTKSGSKISVPMFLSKLLNILEDKECEQIISWTSSSDGFKINNTNQFSEKVLPKYFKHQNYSSFVRQLNMYGFNKTRGIQSENIYQHPFFIRGNRSNLKKIERRNPISEQVCGVEIKIEQIKKQEKKTGKQIEKIRQKQLQIQQKFKQLFNSNRKVFNQNVSIMTNVKKQDKKQQKVLSKIFETFKIYCNANSFQNNKQIEPNQLSESSTNFQRIKSEKMKQENIVLQQSLMSMNKFEEFLQLNEFEQFQQIDASDKEFQCEK